MVGCGHAWFDASVDARGRDGGLRDREERGGRTGRRGARLRVHRGRLAAPPEQHREDDEGHPAHRRGPLALAAGDRRDDRGQGLRGYVDRGDLLRAQAQLPQGAAGRRPDVLPAPRRAVRGPRGPDGQAHQALHADGPVALAVRHARAAGCGRARCGRRRLAAARRGDRGGGQRGARALRRVRPMPTPETLAELESYYDTAPRASATAHEVGPFTLFQKLDPAGWDYYARPRLGLDRPVTVDDVDLVRARQRSLGVPESLEWVHETTPSLRDAVRASGLSVADCPLLVLAAPVEARAPGYDVRLLSPDDALGPVLGA